MEEFVRQFIQMLKEIENYLLNVNCLSLNPEHIFYEDGKYYFSYCPMLQQNLWAEFHELTEYFVRETDYEDKEAIYLAYELHKSSMEERRYKSKCNMGMLHFLYSFTIVKVGLVITSSQPKPDAMPLVKAVFPAPRSPSRVIIVPFFNFSAIFLPSKKVSSYEEVIYFIHPPIRITR